MRKYDSYKDSGIEWIGEIPSHWGVKKTKVIGKTLAGGTPSTDNPDFWNGDIPWLQSGKVQNNIIVPEDVDKYITELGLSKSATKMISANAVLVALTGATCGNVGLLTFNSTANQSVVGIEFKKSYIPKFNYYQFLSIREQILISKSGGAQGGVSEEVIKNLITVQPTPEEQTAIAAYLDRKTAEIDELIADKKRLLELYEEEKNAIINQAVTKGINPDVPMKDSGIEWLGEIPEHWDTVNFNHYVFLRHGYQFRNFDFTSTGIKVIKITQLKASGELEVNDVSYISEDRLDEFRDILIVEGDILMALTGGTIGKIIRAPKIEEPLLQNYRVGNFFPKNDLITKDFLFWVLSSDLILKQIFYDQRETGQPNIGKEDFGRMFFVLPSSTNEQDKIVEFIKSEINRIDAKKAKTKKLIDLLTEYRTALISEVVTGKIKVIE